MFVCLFCLVVGFGFGIFETSSWLTLNPRPSCLSFLNAGVPGTPGPTNPDPFYNSKVVLFLRREDRVTQSPGASAVPEKRAWVLVDQSESAEDVLPKYWANSNAVPQRTAAPCTSGLARLPSRFSMQESRLSTGAGLSTAKRLGEETPGKSAQGMHSGVQVWPVLHLEFNLPRQIMRSLLLGMCKGRLGD